MLKPKEVDLELGLPLNFFSGHDTTSKLGSLEIIEFVRNLSFEVTIPILNFLEYLRSSIVSSTPSKKGFDE